MSYADHAAAWRKVGFEHFVEHLGFKKIGRGGWYCPVCGDTPGNKRGEHCRVDADKELYNCFACKSRGEVISGGSYIQALQAVEKSYSHASKAEQIARVDEIQGVKVDDGANKPPLKRDVVSTRKAFVRACVANLPKGGADYMHGRGIVDAVLKEFGAGYSDSSELKVLTRQGYTENDLFAAGILKRGKKGNYNAFRNRVVVMAGDNVYGRDIRPKDKVVLPHNYTTSANRLWNAESAEALAAKKSLERLFVVESIFDAFSVHQLIREAGEGTKWCVVATLGTKGVKDDELTAFVKKVAPQEVVIIPDSDPWFHKGTARAHAAGQVAGSKKAASFEAAGIKVRVAVLPSGCDPNDMTAKLSFTGKEFRRLVNDALSLLQYRLFCVSHYLDTKTEGGREAFLNKARAYIQESQISCSSELYAFIAKLARMEVPAVEEALKGDLMKSQVLKYVNICKNKGWTVEQIAAHLASLS